MSHSARYQAAVTFLEGLQNLPATRSYMEDRLDRSYYLNRMRVLLEKVGRPDRDQKFIHITGTAGKGTVTAMLEQTLLAAGKTVGAFTSPWITELTESIRVDGKDIDPEQFADLVEEMKPVLEEFYVDTTTDGPSLFEILLAMALLHFRRQSCAYTILEVGAGGRFDATNVIEQPLVTAITNIDYDHTDLFGDTLEEIAFEKAGIIKKSASFVTTEARPNLLTFFQAVCAEQGASFQAVPILPNQDPNSALVTAIVRQLGLPEKEQSPGLYDPHLPCRFETVQREPLIVLDGAHNRLKMQRVVAHLKETPYRRLFLLLGMAANKDHVSMLQEIIPLADIVFFTRFQKPDRRCTPPSQLLRLAQEHLGATTQTALFLDPHQALKTALAQAQTDDLVLVTGSFYLAGELRRHWISS